MTTYLMLNLIFLLTAIVLLPKNWRRPRRAWWLTLGIVVVLTAIFDPLIIALGIVDYDQSKILGLTLLGAPIEDFFYALYAAIIVPLLWNKIGDRRADNR